MTIIAMDTRFKDAVRTGEKQVSVRQGRRDLWPGPATLQYADGDTDEIQIWEVEYLLARDLPTGYYASLLQFYPDLRLDDEVTRIGFELQ